MPTPVTLSGKHVRLEPLSTTHVAPLLAAATESRETYGYTWVPADEESMRSYVDSAVAEQAAGTAMPFAVFDTDGVRALGCTRIFDFASWSGRDFPDAGEIGHTWYAASAQRTATNTETKLLLLSYTFEDWNASRITLKTDARNERSRNAILRLGARFDGILRAQQLASDGTIRDTAYYSIIAAEWPAVKENLQRRLDR